MLGPLLFLIYINDLPSCVTSRVRLFADDVVIYRTISSDIDRQCLQSDLDAITLWCSKWLMSLNISKTKLMTFNGRKSRIENAYFINNSTIESSTSYKYLGLHFQSDLTWHHHINLTLAAANRTLGILKRTLKQAPPLVRKQAYTTIIRPKIEYAAAIWDPHQVYLASNLEALQNRAARFIFQIILHSPALHL